MKTKPSIFISYEAEEAGTYAATAKEVFEQSGYRAWVWDLDRSLAGFLREEVAQKVNACNYFLHICTKGSEQSEGQRYEREMAYTCHKTTIILTFEPSFVPLALWPYKYELVAPDDFRGCCLKVAKQLARQPLPAPITSPHREGEALEPA